jgi:hypothetical protein
MTIFQPSKKFRLNFRIFLPAFLLVAGILMNIAVYNAVVDTRHSLTIKNKALNQLEAETVELKNHLYKILDAANAVPVAAKLSLVKESRPEYFDVRLANNQ